MMIYLEAALLTCMVIDGALCALSDCKTSLVPNKAIVAGFFVGLALHIGLLLTGYAAFYPTWLLNMVLADLLAFGMFYIKMWAAGDAKLFMLMFFLLPPRLLDNGSLAFCIIPYMFIFIPALGWMAADSIVRLIRKEKTKKQPLQINQMAKNICINLIESTALYSIASYWFSSFIAEESLFCAVVMIVYVLWCNSRSWMRKWQAILAHGIVIVIFWGINSWKIALPDWSSQLVLVAVILCQQFLAMYNYQLIPTQNVKTGMILSAETVFQFQISRVQGLPVDASEELSAKISEAQAAAVRRWEQSAHGQSTVWIVRKVPFAIMILIGFVTWSILRIGG